MGAHVMPEIEAAILGVGSNQTWEEIPYQANLPDPLAPLPVSQSTPDLIAVGKGNSCDNSTQLIA